MHAKSCVSSALCIIDITCNPPYTCSESSVMLSFLNDALLCRIRSWGGEDIRCTEWSYMDKHRLSQEFYEHLTEKLLPFWVNLRDDENGGYYGYMDFDLAVDCRAVKGCILNSRILWFFANAYLLFTGEEVKSLGSARKNARFADLCLDNAKHAYEFMMQHCIDEQYGGVFWAVNYDGTTADDIKHTYNQAFAIYALSSYFDVTGDLDAYRQACSIMEVIEKNCTDAVGYLEAFTRNFTPVRNEKLSDNGIIADKTMNTLLHVLEAYTELLRVTKKYLAQINSESENYELFEGVRKRVFHKLCGIIEIIVNKIYNPLLRRQEVFFDHKYHSLIDLHSYGHDIEASWLAERALEVMDDVGCRIDMEPIIETLAECVLEKAYVNHSLLNECEKGENDTHRIWWVQAEAVVGFMNEGQKCLSTGELSSAEEFFDAACNIWDFIQEKQIDWRDGSEWFWSVDENFEPVSSKPMVDPWKCPYHNGRMCIEMIRRLG